MLVLPVHGSDSPSTNAPPDPPPSTPREFYNAGTRQLHEGKLREAESSLEAALATQTPGLQPPALFNLGHVRFSQGLEALKKGPSPRPVVARGGTAAEAAAAAIREAEEALASNEVQKMVASYLGGRGTRRELRAATRAVRSAMQVYTKALDRWQRAAGDFKSALELNPADAEARENAETVERCIARLVDSLREMQQMSGMLGDKNRELLEKLRQLRGRIPEPDMPPGAAGEEEEEEEENPQMPQGRQEAETREGKEMSLSPEQAAWLLESFRLDGERRLPMGQQDPASPRSRARKPW